nr:thioesterase family protein [Flavimaribacter sediminis]
MAKRGAEQQVKTNAPFLAPPAEIKADWIDYNGHLNMAYYNVLFDDGADKAFGEFGMTADYVRENGLSFYVAELHVCYLREVHQGDSVRVSFRVLDLDAKRMHAYQELIHPDGWVSATSEVLYLHIDASGPKVAPIPADMYNAIDDMRRLQSSLPWPERAGRSIAINRK